MTSSIKISDEAKLKLEEFIAKIRMEKKVKIRQQDLLSKIIIQALNDEKLLIENLFNESTSFEKDPLWVAIHNPIKTKKPLTGKNLDVLEEELWEN